MIYNSIIELVGNTPLVRLNNISPEAELYAKVEFFNPAGSVKDRAALYMIAEAEEKGLVKAGGTLIAPTSGNTGIGLCAVGGLRGYKVILTMPESMSTERIKLIKAYGGEVVLTSAADGMAGCVKKADELAHKIPNSAVIRQFESEANAKAHYETTGVEIYRDLPDVDIFVAGIGTGGTVTGIARYLKEQKPDVKIIGIEPADSPLITKGYTGAHQLQGIGANFIPEVLDLSLIDEVIAITADEAFGGAELLSKKEAIFCGISSGAALCGAMAVLSRPENKGKKAVVLLPDGGERYLSVY